MEHNGRDLVVDGNGLFARSYYAAQANSVLKYLDEGYLVTALKSLFAAMRVEIGVPKRILFCFDGKAKTQKPRKPKPQDYENRLVDFTRFVRDAFGDDAYAHHADYEADDLVATVAYQSSVQGIGVTIISGDKDLQQLRTSQVEYYCLNRKHLLTEKEICDKWAVHKPIQVAVALALLGDPGDGVNGVDKYGPKAVQKMFDQIPKTASLEEVIDRIAAMLTPEKQEQFFTSLEFTLLNTDAGRYEPTLFIPNMKLDLDGPAGDAYYRGLQLLDPQAAEQAVDDWDP